METPEEIKLRWEDFGANTRVALKELKEEKEFLDVTLLAEDGKRVQASKVVLAAGSSFFLKILRENPHPCPLIYLKGVHYKHLLSVSDFLYTGEVSVPEEDLNQFLEITEDLKIKGLIPTKTVSGGCTTPAHQNKVAIEESVPVPMDTHPHSQISPPSPYSYHPHSPRSLPLQGGQVTEEPGLSHGISHSHDALFPLQDPVAIEETAPPPWMPHPTGAMNPPLQGQVTVQEPAPVPRVSYSHSFASSHVLNTVPQSACEEDHRGMCNIKIETIEAIFSHKEPKEETLDSSSDMVISEATDSILENQQLIHDWYGEDEENSMALAGEQDGNIELDIRNVGNNVDSNGDMVVTEALEREFINEQSTNGRYEEDKENDDIVIVGEQNPHDKVGSSGKYHCTQCSKKFSVLSILNLHLKVHDVKKAYSTKR